MRGWVRGLSSRDPNQLACPMDGLIDLLARSDSGPQEAPARAGSRPEK